MSHTHKKPYQPSSQPSITSFFPSSTSTSASLSTAAPSSSAPSRLSPLPDPIQSSLLNVGMRVRKSVPEGYKTHKALTSTFPYATAAEEVRASSTQPDPTLYTINAKRTRGAGSLVVPCTGQDAAPSSSAPPALLRSTSSRSRELQPFCGLHSVGGIGSQADDVPGLGWSQPSMVSMSSESEEVESGRKRGLDADYEEEMEAELDGFFEGLGEEERGQRVGTAGRRIKAMRGRGRGIAKGRGMAGGEVQVVGDFEDGDVGFLEPMDVDV
ncbi:hypothetical protein KVT40_001663 [Elsinoe batatas]|uniref:Uncharacterized protein n=1 Tax=Elsinoe batatas TaxID=2601811 RepID=A0A8K0PLK3_9PEZI|nr:hypothetical protein KVT40_001663 [Elsinoe batatas]